MYLTVMDYRLVTMTRHAVLDAAAAYDSDPSDTNRDSYKAKLKTYLSSVNSVGDNGVPRNVAFSPVLLKADSILDQASIDDINTQIKKSYPSRDGKKPTKLSDIEAEIQKRKAPEVKGLPSGWTVSGDWDAYQARLAKEEASITETAKNYGDSVESAILYNRTLNAWVFWDRFRGTYRESGYVTATSPNGSTIKLYKRRDKDAPLANTSEISDTAEVLADIENKINLPKGITYSLLSSGMSSQKNKSSVLGYANSVQGGHTLVDRVRKQENSDKVVRPKFVENDSWHSTDTFENKGAYFRHTAAHEAGHVVAFQIWPNEDDMNREYKALRAEQISKYGKESTHEHFAEAFAKYILTGKASPAFMELLRSKGLLKSQQND